MSPILFATCCDNGYFGLRQLVARGYRIAAVITLPSELGKKYSVAGYADVAPFCERHGIRVIHLDSYAIDPALVASLDFDVFIVNGWNRLIKPEVYSQARLGAIGLHCGHPPIGLGRAPIVWNIIKGYSDIEAYAFQLTPRADDGLILGLQPVEITKMDTARSLYEKVMWASVAAMEKAVARLEAGTPGMAQDMTFAEHYPKRTPVDGWIDFTQPADRLHDFIRAQSEPYPGAFAYLGARKWTIYEAMPFDRFAFRDLPRHPGRIVATLPMGPVVMTGSETLWLTRVLVDGAPVEDWEAMAPDLDGAVLTPEPA